MKINEYIKNLNLDIKSITKIEHEDTRSSDVYQILLKNNVQLILKVCFDALRYKRELYFLNRLKDIIPVPKVIDKIEPREEQQGVILMECLPGEVLNFFTFTNEMSFKMGELLAQLHEIRTNNYGDLTIPDQKSDPIKEIWNYINESVDECKDVVVPSLLNICLKYLEQNMVKTEYLDGPCIVHRDYKPGNVLTYNNKITGIIDWEGAKSSFAQEDFARMDHIIWDRNLSSKKPFLDGYASVRKLPNIEEVMPLLRVSKCLGAIGFTIARKTWQTRDKEIYKRNILFLQNFFKHK